MRYSVENLEDLANAGLEAWYTTGFAAVVDEVGKTNPSVAKLKAKSIVYPNELRGTMVEHLGHRNITALMIDKLCHLTVIKYVDLYSLPNACMRRASWHYFVMAKGSVYTEVINTHMSRLTQAGLVQKTSRVNKPISRSTYVNKKPINVRNMLPALLVLLCELCCSLLVFLFERLMAQILQKSKRSSKIIQVMEAKKQCRLQILTLMDHSYLKKI